VIVTGVEAVTAVVRTVKVALLRCDRTVTPGGTGNAAALLESDTTTPPEGAAPLSVTLTLAMSPPLMLAGATLTPVRVTGATGATVTFAVLVVEL